MICMGTLLSPRRCARPSQGSRSRVKRSAHSRGRRRCSTLVEEILQPRAPPPAAVPVAATLIVIVIIRAVAALAATPGLLRRRRCGGLGPSAGRGARRGLGRGRPLPRRLGMGDDFVEFAAVEPNAAALRTV